jgi:DNA-binding GntR family transcriptional regulator
MMRALKPQPGLTEQVYEALLEEIFSGRLRPGMHLVQETIAEDLGVSRQPVQQALAMLKNDGLLREQGRRGLTVSPLDRRTMRQHYEIRAALDGLGARLAAVRARSSAQAADDIRRRGEARIAAGIAALEAGNIAVMVAADVAFHAFIYEASGNSLLAPTADLHWRQLRRVMGEVLRCAGTPQAIWDQHRAILEAVLDGDATIAEQRSLEHVEAAAARLEAALAGDVEAPTGSPRPGRGSDIYNRQGK